MDCRASLRMKRTLWRLLPCTAFCHLCIFRFPFTQRRIPSMYSFISCVPAESFKLCIMFTFFLLSWISSLFPFCLLRCLLWLLIWISVSRYMNYCLYLKTLKCDFWVFSSCFCCLVERKPLSFQPWSILLIFFKSSISRFQFQVQWIIGFYVTSCIRVNFFWYD